MQAARHHRRLRTPRRHGECLIDPPWQSLPQVLEQNRQLLRQREFVVCGRPASQLRTAARQQMVAAARHYSSQYRDRLPAVERDGAARIVLTGHQPELFHAGVWFKNFVLDELARRTSTLAVHLIIDNDVCKSTALRIPAGSQEQPGLQSVVFDRPLSRVPLEERPVVDADRFASFGERATSTIRPLVAEPLLPDAWPRAVEAARRTGRMGLALAQMRHQLEADCNLETLELPLSSVCDAEPFRWFTAFLLLEAERFLRVHNEALREHRRSHRIRSRTHPVPELQHRNSWCETPLWVWQTHAPQRQRLLVRQHHGCLQLWDLSESSPPRDVGRADDAASVVTALANLHQQGVKIRPRALTTTLYARLFLCDLFVHGIGGAKYDELTDVLIERLFGLAAPAFVTATATLHLPIEHLPLHAVSLQPARQRLRELRFHPERYLSDGDQQRDAVAFWVQQKSSWLHREMPRGQRAARHAAIVSANDALQAYVQPQRRAAERQLQRAAARLRQRQILESREYAFCLFPLPLLREILRDSLHASH